MLVNTTDVLPAPLTVVLVHPDAAPEVKVPPRVAPNVLEVFKALKVAPLVMLLNALATCAAEAPLDPAVKVRPAMVKV